MVVRNVLQNEKSFAFCKSLITLDVTLNATAVTAGQQPWARHIYLEGLKLGEKMQVMFTKLF